MALERNRESHRKQRIYSFETLLTLLFPKDEFCGMPGRRRLHAAILLCATAVMLSAEVHAEPPARNYVGNFLGYNAEPSNYLSVQGQVSSGATTVSIYLEKMISSHSSFSVFTGEEHYTGRFAASGWSNLELSYKHVMLDFREDELLFSIAPSLEIPTGDPNIVDTNPRAGLDILYEKGLGDLPEAVAPLRALAIEGDFYWDSKISGTHDDLLYSNVEIEYSVEYLCANVIAGKSITLSCT